MRMPYSSPRVLHLIERLSLGGAGRSLIAAAACSRARHRIMSLRPADQKAAAMAHEAGLAMADRHAMEPEIAASDLVHVHFWNTPELYAALRKPLPACHMVLTSHVLGTSAPHILTRELRTLADRIVATTPATPADHMIPAAADFSRIDRLSRRPGETFTIGYVGALDFAKLHPDYVSMHAAIGGDFRVLVGGSGADALALNRQAEAAGMADRFSWQGYLDDIGSLLGSADVFGYPLRPDSFATSELVLHEAMYAGLPCVLLASEGAAPTVTHGETGFVVHSAEDYAACMRNLRDNPDLRLRMGQAAASHASAKLGAARIAPQLDALYDELVQLPRRKRSLTPVTTGHDAWLYSLGEADQIFAGSLAGDPACDEAIIAASPALASADAGGVLHYRRAFPSDVALRFWSGLVLFGQGRFALAAGEFKAALDAGFAPERSRTHLCEAIAASRESLPG